ncbi:MAG TPA: recombinase family protein [Streptosporangiaceae bacterium]|nr:recombinase family protein [Streptosporangiaceae bacterium]
MKVIVAARLSQDAEGQTGLDTQDEDAQEWAEDNGHEVIATVPDKKSGTVAMWDRPNLKPWVTQPDLMARYDGIVAAKQDRLSREKWADEARLRLWAEDNGKTLFIVDRNMKWPPASEDDVSRWNDGADQARREWVSTSKRYTRMQRKLREAGYLVGRPAWGFRSVCEHCGTEGKCQCGPKCPHHRLLMPTADGRKYVPAIFQMSIDGKSLRDIAAWLDSQGVRTTDGKPWHEGYLGNRLIKNPVYYGQRRNAGTLETEALVSYSVWQEANAALASRTRPGRGTVKHEKTLLCPVCGNPDCDATGEHPSPMYRVFSGKDRIPHYRCTGRGPQRKGCGNMVLLAKLDAAVIESALSDQMTHRERVFVPGDDRSDEIGKLREAAMSAYRAGDKARFMQLDAEADRLATLPSRPAHWEYRVAGPCADVAYEAVPEALRGALRETHALCQHQTEGEWFASLDDAQRREELRKRSVSAYGDSVAIGPPTWLPADAG